MMNGNYLAMKNYIDKKGSLCKVSLKYLSSSVGLPGDITLNLNDTYGLQPGHTLQFGSELVEISAVLSRTSILIKSPLASDHTNDKYLTKAYECKALQGVKPPRITQDYLEYTRRIRMSKFELINYGAEIEYLDKLFFVIGIDEDQWSIGVKLREANASITIARMTQGAFNGFSYDEELKPIYTDVHGHFEYITSNMLLGEAGYNPSTISYITIPDDYEVKFNDTIIIDKETYRVAGLDRYRFKNMLFIIVDYDNTKSETGVEGHE